MNLDTKRTYIPVGGAWDVVHGWGLIGPYAVARCNTSERRAFFGPFAKTLAVRYALRRAS